MSDSLIRKENWKSDIRLAVTLTLAGEAIAVPNHAFTLRFRVCNGREYYDCYRDKSGKFVNCKPSPGNEYLLCFLDNHHLGIGDLHCEYYDYAPDRDFADGDKLTVVPQVLPIQLVSGAGDDGEQIDVEIVADINSAISDAVAATSAANLAAADANLAASRAETATGDAEAAATQAESAASSASSAATAANAAAVRANDAADGAMSIAEAAARAANEAASRATDAGRTANTMASLASDAAASANRAAERANDATKLALNAADIASVSATLANYGTIRLTSDGVNEFNQGVIIAFDSINELTVYYRGERKVHNIANGTIAHVGNGSGLYYSLENDDFVILPINESDRGNMRNKPVVCLAEVSRGLIVGGHLLEMLTDYRFNSCSHFLDGSFVSRLTVGQTLSNEQGEILFKCRQQSNALKIGGSVADVSVRTIMGATIITIRYDDYVVTISNLIVDSITRISAGSELTQDDFDEICV